MKKFILQVVFIFIISNLISLPVLAQVTITEIMYDAPGTDDKHEWIEIKNSGNDGITLSNWKFFEGETNHSLTFFQGSEIVAAGGYAVIASDPATFLVDWPNFSGPLFDSVFSLVNTGEILGMKNEALELVDSISYNASHGAAGDGNSLHRSGVALESGVPSPGRGQGSVASPQSSIEGNESSGSSSTSTETFIKEVKKDPVYTTKVSMDEIMVAGVPTRFKSSVARDSLPTLRGYHHVAFGDGTVRNIERKKYISDIFFHTYEYPGEYIVVFEYFDSVLASEPLISQREKITVLPIELTIDSIDVKGGITLVNNSSKELDLSGWSLATNTQEFQIPKNTIVLPSSTIVFSRKATKFTSFNEVKIFSPRGAMITSYSSGTTPSSISFYKEKENNTSFTLSKEKENEEISSGASEVLLAFSQQEIVEEEQQTHASNILWMIGTALLIVIVLGGLLYIRRKQNSSLKEEESHKETIHTIEGE